MLVNAALGDNGATCESHPTPDCSGTLDGVYRAYKTPFVWRTNTDGIGAWLFVRFAQTFNITQGRLMHVFDVFEPKYHKNIKTAQFYFSDGSSQQVTVVYTFTGSIIAGPYLVFVEVHNLEL